ncbi:MAG TPA: UDP-3-O-(3-hydroxymyristoyl)glucosamine N-acyltransferase [Psychromonas hadalis]|nr:UDP-3-O-(3-hydroxymyristoyl)glucosamine N-acyltransferase [Psychromonas hadalis]
MQTLEVLATQLNAQLVGDKNTQIFRLSAFDTAGEGDITFVSDVKLLKSLDDCKASAIVLPSQLKDQYQGNALFMDEPYVGYAILAKIFDTTVTLTANISRSAQINETATIGKNVAIAANVVIDENVVIGDNCQIFANAVIGRGTVIGGNSKIYPNVTIYSDTIVGKRCILHANCVIGGDGFGNAPHDGKWINIPQLGQAILGDDVEIGSCTTIDRGALSNTVIGNGVKIDNLCQVAHNVEIGDHSAIAGTSSIAGSTKIGKHCILGGAVTVNGHISLADHTITTGNTMIVRSTTKGGLYSSGMPAVENREWRKNTVQLLKIETLFKRVKLLEKQLKNN